MHRLYLTQREYDRLLKQQQGMCCVPWCGSTQDLIAEHSTPNTIYPGKPDQLVCRACHKTKKRRDVKAIAKTKRLNGTASSQYERRKRFGPTLKGADLRSENNDSPATRGRLHPMRGHWRSHAAERTSAGGLA